MSEHIITHQQIEDANRRIRDSVRRTPLILSSHLSELCHGEVFLKLENLQVTNSFKIRGALNKVYHMSRDELRRGIVTASAGNHGQAIAIAAEKLNLTASIVVPNHTPQVKINKIRMHKVEPIVFGDTYEEAEAHAKELARQGDSIYISPYNDELVIAGQGTIGLEILETLPSVDTIVVPVGGGGLISGISVAVKNAQKGVKVIGVQSEASPTMYRSLKAGRLVTAEVGDSVADGLSGNVEMGSITFGIVKRFVDDLVLVKEESIRRGIFLLWAKDGQVAEGAGAAAISPLLEKPQLFSGNKTVAVITGGNIDDEALSKILVTEMK